MPNHTVRYPGNDVLHRPITVSDARMAMHVIEARGPHEDAEYWTDDDKRCSIKCYGEDVWVVSR